MIKRGYAKVLYYLFEGAKTVSQLSRLTGYNKKDLRRIIEGLERLGLVKIFNIGSSKVIVIRREALCLREIVLKELEQSSQ